MCPSHPAHGHPLLPLLEYPEVAWRENCFLVQHLLLDSLKVTLPDQGALKLDENNVLH